MINLLPTDEKREILAGRTNRLLVRYIFLLLMVMLMTVIVFGFVWLYLNTTRSTNQEKIAENEQSSLELRDDQLAINNFRANLQTAKTILNKQVNYSTILLRVASTVPEGVVLDNFLFDPATLGTPTVLNARAKNDAAVLKLKDSFVSSKYYSDVRFNTIDNNDSKTDPYPQHITITVTYTPELMK